MFGYINSIETMSTKDGPGIRTVIFMQGCKLRCIFCHNPETWDKKYNLEISVDDLVKQILKYKNYYGNNGGVTFSGGEPLLQHKFLLEVLKKLKDFGIHTCLDTAGCGNGYYEEILKYVDLVILDVKAIEDDKYFEITASKMDEYNKFLNVCKKLDKDLWIRQVIVPGINDTEDYISKLKEYVKSIPNIKKVELLPYTTLGVKKYHELGIKYNLEGVSALSNEDLKRLSELIEKY
ncbi:MAG: pyruvate formate lyase-activating protein [Firmicutes bacterium]|nr:pyruvate formate lyase-activating protein [Bacillota bacterium]